MHSVCVHSAGCQRTCEHRREKGRESETVPCPGSSVCKHGTKGVGPTPASHVFRSSNPINLTTSEDGDPSHLPFVICHCLKRCFLSKIFLGFYLPEPHVLFLEIHLHSLEAAYLGRASKCGWFPELNTTQIEFGYLSSEFQKLPTPRGDQLTSVKYRP